MAIIETAEAMAATIYTPLAGENCGSPDRSAFLEAHKRTCGQLDRLWRPLAIARVDGTSQVAESAQTLSRTAASVCFAMGLFTHSAIYDEPSRHDEAVSDLHDAAESLHMAIARFVRALRA